MPDMATIQQTAKRLAAEGMPVSVYALRKWVNSGLIPSVKCGPKALLYYPNVLSYIQNGDRANPTQQKNGGIRRVEVGQHG